MQTEPLVSVVIPVYPTMGNLPRAIDSVRNQTYRNVEIVVVTDGVTEKERLLVGDYVKSLPEEVNVKVIHHHVNRTLFQTRRTGWRHATGHYIMNLDHDDELGDHMTIERAVDLAEREDADMVIFRINTSRSHFFGTARQTNGSLDIVSYVNYRILRGHASVGNVLVQCDVVFKAVELLDVVAMNIRLNMCEDMIHQIAFSIYATHLIEAPGIGEYIYHHDNTTAITKDNDRSSIREQCQIADALKQKIYAYTLPGGRVTDKPKGRSLEAKRQWAEDHEIREASRLELEHAIHICNSQEAIHE